jgi:hypothetical protein
MVGERYMAGTLFFLLCSAAFASAGCLWVFLVLFWQYRWLLKAFVFCTCTSIIFGLAFACLLLSLACITIQQRDKIFAVIARTIHGIVPEDGLLQLLPPSTSTILNRTMFELLHLLNSTLVIPLCNWLRLILLVTADLRETEREHLLSEMDREFRQDAFRRPAYRMLPDVAQRILIGEKWKPCPAINEEDDARYVHMATSPSIIDDVDDEECNEDTQHMPRRRSSVDGLQTLIRNASAANGENSSLRSPVMKRIIQQRMADQTLGFYTQGAISLYESQLSGVVEQTMVRINDVKEAVTTPPERWTLWIPWEITRRSLNLSGRILGIGQDSVERSDGSIEGSCPHPSEEDDALPEETTDKKQL